MKRVCLLASLLVAAAGELCASPYINCSLAGLASGVIVPSGATDANGCWQNTFISASAMDSLNWGAPTNLNTTYAAGLGPATPGNSFAITNGAGPSVRSGLSQSVQVLETPNNVTPSTVTRVDDLGVEYTTQHGWQAPGFNGATNLAYFPGHFGSDTYATPPHGQSIGTPVGSNDQLLEVTTGIPVELLFLDKPLLGVWFQIASLAGTNSNFVVEVQAFASDNSPLGTYWLTESGPAGTGTGGVCATLNTTVPGPTPCDNTPYVGFYDPEGRIRSIYITVFDPSNLNVPIKFAIDSLELEEVPEPAAILMVGAGLAAIALFRRKRWPFSR